MRSIRVSALLLVLFALAACRKYDQLVELDATCDEKWANIEAQLQRRYDLIPNVVKVVKASAKHEEEVLTQVTEARAAATQIKMSSEDLTDPVKFEAFQKAQNALKGSLSRLVMSQEAYPDLKANAAFRDLMVELEGTENRLLRAREEYNGAVKSYNAELRKVGGSTVNKATGKPFKPRIFFSASAEAKSGAPQVDL
jgi:LemA protein